MLQLKIFISSPSDVETERQLAKQVIDRLSLLYQHRIKVEPVLWEREPLLASGHFQDALDPKIADVMVCILWSRLGSPLPDNFSTPDGRIGVTGTEWEFLLAAKYFQELGRPELLVYRNNADLEINIKDTMAVEFALTQQKLVETFFQTHFHNNDSNNTFKRAYFSYKKTDEFEKQLEIHLEKLILKRLEQGLSKNKDSAKIIWHKGSPYRGLQSFNAEHQLIYFGRTRAIGEVIQQFREQVNQAKGFLMLLGMSGNGKSSLAQAGVLPLMQTPRIIQKEIGFIRFYALRPSLWLSSKSNHSGSPVAGLIQTLLLALPELQENDYDYATIEELLTSSSLKNLTKALHAALKTACHQQQLHENIHGRLLLYIDQFEELWTLFSVKQAQAFCTIIKQLTETGLVWILASHRSDFYGRCEQSPELLFLLENKGHYTVKPVTPEELEQIIEQPAKTVGIQFEKDQNGIGLESILRQAIQTNPGALPLLEFTLDELYRKRNDAQQITYQAYEELGGIQGAIGKRAETVCSNLAKKQNQQLSLLFNQLVTIDSKDQTVTACIAEIQEQNSNPALLKLIETLIQARLIVSDAESNKKQRLRITHEALLKHWPQLHFWIQNNQDFINWRSRTETEATIWETENRNNARLLQAGKPLNDAYAWTQTHKEYIDEKINQFILTSQGRLRNRRIMLSATSMLLFIVLSTGAFFLYDYINTRELLAARQIEAERLDIKGTMIAYAGSSGEVVADGEGDHGAYTEVLLKELSKPHLSLIEMVLGAHNNILRDSNIHQTPQLMTSFNGNIFLHNSPNDRKTWAFVVGIGDYQYISLLKNPVNDATAIATFLQNLGFQVDLNIDLTETELEQAADKFIRKIQKHNKNRKKINASSNNYSELNSGQLQIASLNLSSHRGLAKIKKYTSDLEGSLIIVYFAGSGIEIDGTSFFPGTDVNPSTKEDVEEHWFNLTEFLKRLERSAAARVVFLDFCRDNPFQRVSR